MVCGFIWGFICHRNHIFPYDLVVNITRPVLVEKALPVDPWSGLAEERVTHGEHKAMVYFSNRSDMPLIVDLHPWDGGHRQFYHAAVEQIVEEDWNYCHPDFGGPNWNPNTLLSDNVISDINQTIQFMLDQIKGDSKIAIVGGSGGGLASLYYQQKSQFDISACIAWSPLTKLDDFYYQSKRQKLPFNQHMHIATNINEVESLMKELKTRSPYYQLDLIDELCPTMIYAGILDDIIPLSQVTDYYNSYAAKRGGEEISKDNIYKLTMKLPLNKPEVELGSKSLRQLFKAKTRDLELIIHSEGHVTLPELVVEDLKRLLNI